MANQPSRVHEFFRKRLVSLKRKPQFIAMFVLVVAFIYYSFNLSSIANTTALINGPHMGLTGFITILLSTLSLVCFLNSFPHRKKVNIPMLVLMLVMVAAVIFCDYYYGNCITAAITREENRIDPSGANSFILAARTVTNVHMIILCVGTALVALLPVYSKALKKINTNIDVEGNGGMQKIDISGEDA